MKITKLLLLLLSVTLLSAKGGCSSEENEQAIVGEWKWIKSFCCGRNSVWTTVETCNCSKTLTILKDGTYTLQVDSAALKVGTYKIRRGINDFQETQGDSAMTILFGEEDPAYVVFTGDTLLLSRGYMDGTNDYFVKSSKK
jgi:hypothetical protein